MLFRVGLSYNDDSYQILILNLFINWVYSRNKGIIFLILIY
jgi:hypothetical protein